LIGAKTVIPSAVARVSARSARTTKSTKEEKVSGSEIATSTTVPVVAEPGSSEAAYPNKRLVRAKVNFIFV
jgi:hypothetical protein